MQSKIKDIITRSVNERGEIHYTLDEKLFIISEYIREKKGVEPPTFGVGNGMMEAMLLNTAFEISLTHFCNKLNATDGNV